MEEWWGIQDTVTGCWVTTVQWNGNHWNGRYITVFWSDEENHARAFGSRGAAQTWANHLLNTHPNVAAKEVTTGTCRDALYRSRRKRRGIKSY